jgi:hypothetical protein
MGVALSLRFRDRPGPPIQIDFHDTGSLHRDASELPPPLTYATAGVAGGSDVVGGGVIGFFRRAFVFGLVFPFALVFALVFDLVFMVFPFSVASADHGTGAHGNKASAKKKKPPEPDGVGGFSQVAPTGLGTSGDRGIVRLACVEYRHQIRKEMSPP